MKGDTMNIAVIYYSSTGSVHALAAAVAAGAEEAGAEVRLRRVRELAPRSAIDRNPAWAAYVDHIAPTVPEATLEDLEWADGYAFGTPSRFGTPAAQLKQFLDGTGRLWQAGVFVDKPVTSFTSAINAHGGAEATLLSLNNVFYHWGSVLVPPGYSSRVVYAAGGNPYGTSHITGMPAEAPSEEVLAVARYQGGRLARFAERLQRVPA
ncbi:MAG: NAD(P)H:quinone oxidoreductase [Propionibacteriaceae bacterium]|nr:NAD(P)H:quinone oxidoreductase [Propionibacteriaceae bacterium]